jgi:hypothetical protein
LPRVFTGGSQTTLNEARRAWGAEPFIRKHIHPLDRCFWHVRCFALRTMNREKWQESLLACIASGSLMAAASGCGGHDTLGCFDKREGETSCPTDEDEILARMKSEGRHDVSGCESIDGTDTEPIEEGDACCYELEVSGPGLLGCGRPLLQDGRALAARPSRHRAGWHAHGTTPDVSSLPADLRASLGGAWARDAFAEHASVASFGRFALDLLSLGAPAELVASAHRAALDEVVHARLCFMLAQAYRGSTLGPGALNVGGSVAVSSDPAAVAERVAYEACVGETLGALVVAERLHVARDPAVVRVLSRLARDEARHAELGWRTAGWLVARGGNRTSVRVGQAIARAMRDLRRAPERVFDASEDESTRAHGRLGARSLARVIQHGCDDVIGPSVQRLLAAASVFARSRGPATA